ncbi:hypothetical protein J2Z22_004653 [Paenibacillus forsythiae]|uniref:Fibronectin type-III domain-containing protein n=1 Tax=Paenibacillus forsythiae TaxID=365616 RepID=A0ABU3HE16_9BACL|nr:fibronectin type III domain-containing protein [Paenibacillus forsythiae]MDT3429054.1 hypothetical protein [Paenibacillus forsythiae]
MLKKSRKTFMALAAAAMLLVSVSPASALNSNGGGGGTGTGNKPLSLNGYKFTNSSRNTLYLYFDRAIDSAQLDVSQFKVKEHSSATTVNVSSKTLTTGNGYSGTSDSQLDNGSTVALTLASNLSYDTQYDITLSPTIAASNGITLGNYNGHQDTTFVMKTPNSGGSYTGTPTVTFLTTTKWEANPVVVIDRPITNVSTVLSNLSTNFKKSGTTVTQDSVIDSTAVSGAETYTPHANDEHNTLFFPLTGKGSTNTAYNLTQSSNSYTITMPNFTDVSSNSYSSAGSASFTTVSSDIAGWIGSAPTVSTGAASGELDITWSAGSITPVATQFDVYISTAEFGLASTNWASADTSGTVTGSSPYSYTATGLTPGQLYYVRIVPKNAAGVAGFTIAGSGTAGE